MYLIFFFVFFVPWFI